VGEAAQGAYRHQQVDHYQGEAAEGRAPGKQGVIVGVSGSANSPFQNTSASSATAQKPVTKTVAPSGELWRLDTTASGLGTLPSSAIAKIRE
jgi:hypothetical protein